MENEPEYLLKQADRCRTAAKTATDQTIRNTLLAMAKEYEERAAALADQTAPGAGKLR